MKQVTILTQATGHYLQYWEDLARSIARLPDVKEGIWVPRLVVLSEKDNLDRLSSFDVAPLEVIGLEVSGSAWPEATYSRYRNYARWSSQIVGSSDLVLHLDADMIVRKNPMEMVLKLLRTAEVCLVRHPGYFRPKVPWRRLGYYLKMNLLLEDFARLKKHGAIGDWETDRSSTAFVPRARRRTYVCGGAWFVRAQCFEQFVTQISSLIEEDIREGIMAIWHDESYLNSWLSMHSKKVMILPATYCYAEGYENLAGLGEPIIVAVDKGENRAWKS